MGYQASGPLAELILVIDTSTPVPVVTLARNADPIASAEGPPAVGPQHGRLVVPLIDRVLASAGAPARSVDAVGAVLGPGSFTGLRIGLTAAKALAYAWGRPLVGLDSLEVIAQGVPVAAWGGPRLAVLADAQRGDAFAALFAVGPPGGGPAVLSPAAVVDPIAWVEGLGPGVALCTPDTGRFRQRLSGALPAPILEGRPTPAALARLARRELDAGRTVDPLVIEPAYHRRSAAEQQAMTGP